MATPLGTTFSTDEQIVSQGDVTFMEKTVESLVVEFDQAKYEEFLSSSSKSPRTRQYRKVSSEICSQVPSKASPKMACAKGVIAGRIIRKARVNVSHKTREANIVDGQSCHALPLPQPHVTRGSQQPVRHNRNAER